MVSSIWYLASGIKGKANLTNKGEDNQDLRENLSTQGSRVLTSEDGDLTTSGKIEAESYLVRELRALWDDQGEGLDHSKATIGTVIVKVESGESGLNCVIDTQI